MFSADPAATDLRVTPDRCPECGNDKIASHRPIIWHDVADLYAASVFRIPSSLLGTAPAFTEMHAVLLAEPNAQHIAKVDGQDEEAAYRAACILAASVGIELDDG